MLTRLKLPVDGFQAEGAPRLMRLEVAVGARTPDSTELFVRGLVCSPKARQVWLAFAGTTVIREGRDAPEHDITIMGAPSARGFADEVAVAVHLTLDEHSDVIATEMERICGRTGSFLEQFFTDAWHAEHLWEECHDAVRGGEGIHSVRKRLIDDDPGAQQARKLGIIDDAWLSELFKNLAKI